MGCWVTRPTAGKRTDTSAGQRTGRTLTSRHQLGGARTGPIPGPEAATFFLFPALQLCWGPQGQREELGCCVARCRLVCRVLLELCACKGWNRKPGVGQSSALSKVFFPLGGWECFSWKPGLPSQEGAVHRTALLGQQRFTPPVPGSLWPPLPP